MCYSEGIEKFFTDSLVVPSSTVCLFSLIIMLSRFQMELRMKELLDTCPDWYAHCFLELKLLR